MALYADRAHAGRALAGELTRFRGSDAVVLGIARGGVVLAAEVARALELPLGALVVRKLGAKGRPEYAVGAIAAGVRVVTDEAVRWAGMSDAELARVETVERAELTRRQDAFAARQPEVTGRVVIVVDDGVATGASATAACRGLRAPRPARVVLAVPVAPAPWTPPPDLVDEYVCPHREKDLWSVGRYYDDFRQTTDAEVIALLTPE